MTTHNELRELVEKLEQHAALHDSLGDASDEQSQWALDLRQAISIITQSPVVNQGLTAVVQPTMRGVLSALLEHVDRETCTHEETHRGGAIWTICDSCGRKWADDEGGFVPHQDAPAVAAARALLAAAPAAPVAYPSEDHGCVYENGDGICRECADLAASKAAAPAVEVDEAMQYVQVAEVFSNTTRHAEGELEIGWTVEDPDDYPPGTPIFARVGLQKNGEA